MQQRQRRVKLHQCQHAIPLHMAGSLLPGALVNARVKAVLSDGLLVSFLTYFTGTIDPFHLGQARVLTSSPAKRSTLTCLYYALYCCCSCGAEGDLSNFVHQVHALQCT